MSSDSLYTPDELADRWQVEKRVVLDLARKGEIPVVKLTGKALRFRPADVLAYEGGHVAHTG